MENIERPIVPPTDPEHNPERESVGKGRVPDITPIAEEPVESRMQVPKEHLRQVQGILEQYDLVPKVAMNKLAFVANESMLEEFEVQRALLELQKQTEEGEEDLDLAA